MSTPRLRQNFLFGTLLDTALGNNPADTTMNSAALADMQVVGAPNIMAVILDPQSQYGAPEIVWVTAHSSAATSATVTRAQEGSTLRAHSSGEFWVAGPTTEDVFPSTWSAYTPTWTGALGAPSVGNGTLSGSYILIGSTCFFQIYLSFGSSTNGGKGRWRFSLPSGVAGAATIEQWVTCKAFTTGGIAGYNWNGAAYIGGGATVVEPFLSQSHTETAIGNVQNTDNGGGTGVGVPNTGNNYPFTTNSNLVINGSFRTS